MKYWTNLGRMLTTLPYDEFWMIGDWKEFYYSTHKNRQIVQIVAWRLRENNFRWISVFFNQATLIVPSTIIFTRMLETERMPKISIVLISLMHKQSHPANLWHRLDSHQFIVRWWEVIQMPRELHSLLLSTVACFGKRFLAVNFLSLSSRGLYGPLLAEQSLWFMIIKLSLFFGRSVAVLIYCLYWGQWTGN